MTNIAISPATPDTKIVEDTAAMLAAGQLRAYRIRSNDTMRHMDLYPLGSTKRDTAEWISEQVNDGRSVAAVARDLHVSTAAVRRMLLSLEVTEEIEAGEWDGMLTSTGLYADGTVVELQDEVAPDARPGANPTVELVDRTQVSSTTVYKPAEAGGHFTNPTPAYPEATAEATARKARSHG